MMFLALLLVVPFVVAQQDSSFVPSNQQPPQVDVPSGTSQVGGQINIQPASGALPPVDPNNPQANQQPPSSGPSQGQIPSGSLFNNQGGQVNPGQPAQPPPPPTDANNPQQPNQEQPGQQGGATFPNQPTGETTPSSSSAEHGGQPSGSENGPQPASLENGQVSSGNQGASSTQELFGTQSPNHDSSPPMQPSNQNELEHSQEQPNRATDGFTGQPANSAVNAIVSGLVLLFAALIGLL